MKKLFIICISLGCFVKASGQQDPLYGLYLNNPLVINPAYTGLSNRAEATVVYRNQWAAFDGNPTTLSANGHLSILENRMGTGLSVVTDKIGDVTNTSFGMLSSYKISNEGRTFSFGMQLGAVNYRTDPGKVNLQSPDDPYFTSINETKFNVGAGAIFKTERYMVGFSVPRLMANATRIQNGTLQVYQQHFYLMCSYIYFINERLLLKPAMLVKGVKGAPASVDLNFNLEIDRNYMAGIFTRNFKTFGLSAQMRVMEKFRVAYLFELPAGRSVGPQFTTHEVMISLRTAALPFHDRSTTNF